MPNNFFFSENKKLNISTEFEMWSGPIFTEFSVRKGQNSHRQRPPAPPSSQRRAGEFKWYGMDIFGEHVHHHQQPNLTANIYLLGGDTRTCYMLWFTSCISVRPEFFVGTRGWSVCATGHTQKPEKIHHFYGWILLNFVQSSLTKSFSLIILSKIHLILISHH